ncbi:pyridoxal-dependent decarboxylase [Actinospongicola halichondriae]|uniref:pyridoxal-dependent decarboxylase n=1 Tax=Actinospongicola halichondriae TaxID=3236844 RepID=UPI003D4A9160
MNGDHMSPDEFRRLGHAYVDWVASYWERVGTLPVQSPLGPGDTIGALPTAPPAVGEDIEAVLADLEEVVVPGLTNWQHPSFFAFFPANTSGPGVLADIISSGIGVNGMNWSTSPACTEVEMVMLDWFVQLLGLPDHFRHGVDGPGGGVLQDSASSSTLCTILAARNRVTPGGDLSKLRAYASDQAHSSIVKGARVAGLGDEQVRSIPTDAAFGMDAAALAEAIDADRRAGLIPFWCCATVGSTSSMGIDPVVEIARICGQADVWCHVDAAMAGSAAVCEELRWVTDGADVVDSWSFNPHKWLFTTFDCSCLWLADARPLVDALSISPAYLRNEASDAGAVVDFRDWQIPLGRRFRALKPWLVMRHYGADGLARHIREHVRLGRKVADLVLGDPRFEFAAPPALNLVCFRLTGDDADARTSGLADAVNRSGRALVTPTVLDGRPAIRVCVGQTWTTEDEVDALWALLDETAG